jgi:NAD+ kinase
MGTPVSERLSHPRLDPAGVGAPWRAGVIVHPSRDIEEPMRVLGAWAAEHGAEVVQIRIEGQNREVAEPAAAGDCDLIVSIGGDGTMLASLRAGALAGRPVLGVACGSLGALATVAPDELARALDRFAAGEWQPRRMPALEVQRSDGDDLFALNDISIVRDGIGQVRSVIEVDGVLFCRLAGDGCVVSTPLGSSAYGLAARGPLLAPGTDAFVVIPLPTHGGACPPVVVGRDSAVRVEITAGLGGARLEVDGQIIGEHSGALTVTLRPEVATRVCFSDTESQLTGLRRRHIIVDSPRILAEDGPGC